MTRLSADDAELIRHLFARVTALLEEAHVTATEGQAPRQSAIVQGRRAQELRRQTEQLTAMAVTLQAIAGPRESA